MTSLNIAGFVLALLFFAIIITKKEKHLRDYLLAFFIVLLGTYMIIKYIVQNELFETYPIVTILDIYYWVLLGPTLYIYTIVSIRGENKLRLKYLYALLPAFLVSILFAEYIFYRPVDFFVEETKLSVGVYIGFYIWLYNSIVFYVLTIVALKRHQGKIKNQFSSTKSVDLKWLYYLSNGFAIFLLFLLFRSVMKNLFGVEFPFSNYGISMIVMLIYIFGIGFYGYKQRGIFDNFDLHEIAFSNVTNNPNTHTTNKEAKKQYEKSGLSKEEAFAIINQLNKLMENEQPYLDCELDLLTLANMVSVSPHKLSQVINEYLNKNFFEFVNDYRIGKVKEHLADPMNNQFKIISLASDSGFNSKSAFYNLFKKTEGLTPAEYRKKYQKETV